MGQNLAAFTLRPVAGSDAPRIAELISDWEVVRWLSAPPYPYALADAATFLAGLAAARGGLFRHDAIVVDGTLAGLIGIDQRNGGPNLGFWLGRPFWGLGIMGRAAAQLTRDFFAKSAETQLNSGYFSGNNKSWSIQRRLGFEVASEGQLFNRPHGKHLPHVETTLTRARYEQMKRTSS